jgi:hypothetical protein
MQAPILSRLEQAIEDYCHQQYGDKVSVSFDELEPLDTQTVKVQFTISDAIGFITRHYGKAFYTENQFQLRTKTI